VAQSNVKLTVDGSQATRALNQVQRRTQALTGSVHTLRNAFLGIGAAAVIRQTVRQATNYEKLNIRLKLLTRSQGTYADSLLLVEQAQKKFGISSAEALEGVTNLQARLGPLGTSMEEISSIFNGFNTAAILSGASAQEQAGAMRQLTQALGSGVLRGEEFNSISEQMSAVQKPIADQLGINVGQLRKYAAEGRITKSVVVRAFKEIEKEGGKMLEELIKKDPTMAFKALDNQVKELNKSIGRILTPTVLKLTRLFTDLVDSANELASGEGSAFGKTILIFAGTALAIKAVMTASAILTTQIIALKTSFVTMQIASAAASGQLGATTTMAFAAAGGFAKATAAANAFKLALAKTGIGLAVISLGYFIAKIIEASDEQKRFNKILEEGSAATVTEEIEKVTDTIDNLEKKIAKIREANGDDFLLIDGTEELTEQLNTANKRLDDLNERLVIAQGIELWKDFEKTKKQLMGQNQELKDSIERAKLLTDEAKNKFDLDKKINELNEKYGEDTAAVLIEELKQKEVLEQQLDLIKKKQTEADKLKEKMKAVGDEIKDNIRDNLREAITGAQSFGDAMSNVLKRIRDKILDAQLDKLIDGAGDWFSKKADKGGFFGGVKKIFGFADGGRPPAGRPSVVGERGPELFVPDRAGTIIPNHQMGGSTTININIDGAGEGGTPDQRQLGMLISASVRNIIAQEQRPGGTLA
tara:strand:+ start:14 stop:2119 length:2106 start_codon:yes stop_codon:yes gene_type:complete